MAQQADRILAVSALTPKVTACDPARGRIARIVGRDEACLAFALLVGFNQLGYFRTVPHGFDQNRVPFILQVFNVRAPLHLEHKEKLNRALPGRFYELYGLTEGFMTVLDKTHYGKKSNSVGLPQPFFEMRIVNERGEDLAPGEVGEIVGRGPALMPGYYKRPDLTSQAIIDGWLHTGDVGYTDEDGFLYLVDRK